MCDSFSEFMMAELAESYINITYIKDATVWSKHIYDVQEISLPGDILDCSTECKVLQAPQGCQFFFFSVSEFWKNGHCHLCCIFFCYSQANVIWESFHTH